MKQIDRIKKMEEYYDEINPVLNKLNEDIEKYLKLESKYQKLVDYYTSSLWMKDYEDDENNKLPKDLKRGVLAEDTIYNLIGEHKELIKKIMLILNNEINQL